MFFFITYNALFNFASGLRRALRQRRAHVPHEHDLHHRVHPAVRRLHRDPHREGAPHLPGKWTGFARSHRS